MYLFSDLAGVWANNCCTFAFISDSIEMAPYQQANRGIPREVASKWDGKSLVQNNLLSRYQE